MSKVDEAILSAQAAAQRLGGVKALAAMTSVNDDTARRLLGVSPPAAIKNLKELEAAAAKVLSGQTIETASGAEETA